MRGSVLTILAIAMLLLSVFSVSAQRTSEVEFMSFNVTVRGDGNLLKWTVRRETNNCMFEVYRSTDTAQWSYILTIYVGGSSVAPRSYLYLDTQPLDTSYYLIMQVDCDGAFSRIQSERIIRGTSRTEMFEKKRPNVHFGYDTTVSSGDYLCDMYVYSLNGAIARTARLLPNTVERIHISGYHIIELVWVEGGEPKRSAIKSFNK